jgi:hypothetical protein
VDYNQQSGHQQHRCLDHGSGQSGCSSVLQDGIICGQSNLTMYLEKSSPNSENSNLVIPPESYNLLLYKNHTILAYQLQCSNCRSGRRWLQRVWIQCHGSLFFHPGQPCDRHTTDLERRQHFDHGAFSIHQQSWYKYPMAISFPIWPAW